MATRPLTVAELHALLRDAGRVILTPARGASAHVAVVDGRAALGALTILGDSLAEAGFADAADVIARFIAGLEYAYGGPRRRGAVRPTRGNWERLLAEATAALRAMARGYNPRAWEARPTARLVAWRIRLDRQGYARSGRYYGDGPPVYHVESVNPIPVRDLLEPDRSRHWSYGDGDYGQLFHYVGDGDAIMVETTVRAPDAQTARWMVADELGVKATR